CLIIFGVVGLALAWLVRHVSAQIGELVKAVPGHIQSINATTRSFGRRFTWLHLPGQSGSMVDRGIAAAAAAIEAGGSALVTSSVHLAGYLPWVVLIPIVAFFLLKDGEDLTAVLLTVLPPRWQSQGARFL